MDYALSSAAILLAAQSFFVKFLVKFFADFSGYALLGVALLWIIRDVARKKISQKIAFGAFVQMGVAAFLSRGIITEAIRFFWHRQRPLLLPEASFPSGHAAFYFAIATVLYFYNKKLGIFAFAISIAMGIARVFAGYHWPSDIAGGAVIGIASALLTLWVFKKFYVQKS